jgi:hypothetical protein
MIYRILRTNYVVMVSQLHLCPPFLREQRNCSEDILVHDFPSLITFPPFSNLPTALSHSRPSAYPLLKNYRDRLNPLYTFCPQIDSEQCYAENTERENKKGRRQIYNLASEKYQLIIRPLLPSTKFIMSGDTLTEWVLVSILCVNPRLPDDSATS